MKNTENPVIAPEKEQEKAIQSKTISQAQEESQVIIHCSFTGKVLFSGVRVWKTTFLYPKGFDEKCNLVHCENITMYPQWTVVGQGQTLVYTLIFTGLPKGCTAFDLVEEIPEPGGMNVCNIQRNETDVYHVEL